MVYPLVSKTLFNDHEYRYQLDIPYGKVSKTSKFFSCIDSKDPDSKENDGV